MYQGRLTDADGEPLYGGVDDVRFRVYAYAETEDPNPVYYDTTATITCDTNGVFTIQLGPITDVNAFSGETRYLGIKVGTDDEMTPYQLLTSTLYSFSSAHIADNCVTSGSIANGSIMNADINDVAAISGSKISGTAATLSYAQTFTGAANIFSGSGYVKFYDSTMRVSPDGIRIGDADAPSQTYLLRLARNYNESTESRYGLSAFLFNDGTGDLTGISSIAEHTQVGGGEGVYGVATSATGDGPFRIGARAFAKAKSDILTTGESYGVQGWAYDGESAYGVLGFAAEAVNNWGGYFVGNALVSGILAKGGGSFKIDHPLDPENKYLQHSFVESPDMMNVYNGNVITDGNGEAVVELPHYFEALNKDFRYQLTCIGGFAPVYIAEEISGTSFRIAGGEPGMKISWQVTGIRKDAFAEANRIEVEVDKPPREKGKYMHPEAFGLGLERSMHYEMIKNAREAAEQSNE
jgi:hypothetical protein